MAKWRFVSDEEDKAFRESETVPTTKLPENSLERLSIYEVVSGKVKSPSSAKTTEAPTGWYAKVLDAHLPMFTFEVVNLAVKSHGKIVELKEGTLVTLFPPDHLEKARELQST